MGTIRVSLVSCFGRRGLRRVLLWLSTVVFGIRGMGWSWGGLLLKSWCGVGLLFGTLSIGVLVGAVGGRRPVKMCWRRCKLWTLGPL